MSNSAEQAKGGQFYFTLKKYRPICYSGKGAPTFLLLKERALSSLPCILFINALFILVIILQSVSPEGKDHEFSTTARNLNTLIALFVDIFYALTILLNPGIKSKEDASVQSENHFCMRCQRETTNDMTHCIECETCVQDLDHHCSFFGKCIAGGQRFAFYGFITFVFLGFIALLGSLAVLMSPS